MMIIAMMVYLSIYLSHPHVGACEESNVKILCAYTGDNLGSIDIYPERRSKSLYIQVWNDAVDGRAMMMIMWMMMMMMTLDDNDDV